MRSFGIDGYAIVGWGVVGMGQPLCAGSSARYARTPGVPFERRLDEVYTGIKEVIGRTKPEVLAIKAVLPAQPDHRHRRSQARRSFCWRRRRRAAIYEVHPMQGQAGGHRLRQAVKKAGAGDDPGTAACPPTKPDDTADALAMAITSVTPTATSSHPLFPPGGGTDFELIKNSPTGRDSPTRGGRCRPPTKESGKCRGSID